MFLRAFLSTCLSSSSFPSLPALFFMSPALFLSASDQKPLSVEVGEASTLRLLVAEQENAELRRRLEELQVQWEVMIHRNDL